MLNISGNDVKIWVNEREGRNGKFKTYSISVGKKVEDKYINKYVKVRLARDIGSSQTIWDGARVDFEGFPTIDVYKDKDGKEHRDIMIFIQRLRVTSDGEESVGFDDYAEVNEAVPF